MPQLITKKHIAQSSVPRVRQDGILDIFLALSIAFAVIAIATDLFWLAGILAASLIPVWAGARHAIITPRRGEQPLSGNHPGQSRILFVALTFLGVLALVLGLVVFLLFVSGNSPAGLRAWFSTNLMLTGWIFGAGILCLVALFTGIPRFYLYALLALMAGIWGPMLDFPPLLYVVGLAGLMLLVGLATLARFKQAHPV